MSEIFMKMVTLLNMYSKMQRISLFCTNTIIMNYKYFEKKLFALYHYELKQNSTSNWKSAKKEDSWPTRNTYCKTVVNGKKG